MNQAKHDKRKPVYVKAPPPAVTQPDPFAVPPLTKDQHFARDWWTQYERKTAKITDQLKGMNYWESQVRDPKNQWMIEEAKAEFAKESGR